MLFGKGMMRRESRGWLGGGLGGRSCIGEGVIFLFLIEVGPLVAWIIDSLVRNMGLDA